MIKNWITAFLLVPVLHSCVVAQRQDSVQVKYADLLTVETAREHLTLLASPSFEGRGTGQQGGEKTAHYLAEQFASYGLKAPVDGSYFQPVDLAKISYQVQQFMINGTAYENGLDFFVQGDHKKNTYYADDIIFVGYGIQDKKHNDLANLDIRDKVVLVINEGEPKDANGHSIVTGSTKMSEWASSRFKRVQELLKKNPKMILATGDYVDQNMERFGKRLVSGRFSLDDGNDDVSGTFKPPVVNISPKLANEILAKRKTSLEQQKSNPATFSIPIKLEAEMGVTKEKLTDPNVLGLLEGSDLKNEIVVIVGHYDHDGILPDGTFFPGADDNGSGTVGVLELARTFTEAKKDGKGPRRSLLFIGLAAEEKGLLGSKFYVENPIFPLENTVACINMDMIGRIDDKHLNGNHNYIHAIGLDKLSSTLKQITETANNTYTQMELDYMYDDPKDPMRLYYRSDHYNFAEKGIPSAFFFSGLHPHYHTPEDTVDKIDFPMMVKREKLVFHVTWEIANRDKRLSVDSNKE
ncbi:M28 family peptidase [Sphingobacterium sp. DN00404]|uniref:M28 family peptidase n=1 Tax=Sphingobacterium micropteri TaxID=2763501 RepID=A0ABR7YS64_9SPHI|nr:M28 family peptidase [Sphingobacterium micropteri]MBD1434134.1 M28 family peptidase [Sphingobacterium micropteri]